MNILKKNLTTALLCLLFGTGVCLIAYPTFSDWWNSLHQTAAIMNYAEAVSGMDAEDYAAFIGKARDYNSALARKGIRWHMTEEEKEEYEDTLRVNEAGVMGYIDIPKIRVSLPIYHGVGENVLKNSIGHLEGTSLPVGGENCHCVLSGHRGLPSARLFTDLNLITNGDIWTITILNETYTYECDEILVVEPTDTTALRIIPGKDYCTLLTCTPYGINTHRLLVRGHRINNIQGEANVTADAFQIQPAHTAPFFAVPILLFLLFRVMYAPAEDHSLDKYMYYSEDENDYGRWKT